jgi:hypothetical protein
VPKAPVDEHRNSSTWKNYVDAPSAVVGKSRPINEEPQPSPMKLASQAHFRRGVSLARSTHPRRSIGTRRFNSAQG